MERAVRIILTIIASGFLLWFIAPTVYGIFHAGSVLGITISCTVIFRFGFANVYSRLKASMLAHASTTVLLRIIQIGSAVFVIYAVVISALMINAMLSRPANNATAVVLGAQVKPWGPSVLLRQRIDAAEKYMDDNPTSNAVVTGGQGTDEIMSEGQCMFETMVSDGIDPHRIYPETKAENTDQNIRYSLRIIEDNGLNRDIAIVSDSYHQLRARLIAKHNDKEISIGAVNTKNNLIGLSAYPSYFVREWIAIPAMLIR